MPQRTHLGDAWSRALREVRRATSAPIAFGGKVNGGILTLEHFVGTRTELLHGLTVQPNSGVGGRAAATGQPVAVDDYRSARSISHEYDMPVLTEGIASTAAVPVIVAGRACGVLYAAVREQTALGDRMSAALTDVAERLAAEISRWNDIERQASVLAARQLADDQGRVAVEQMREADAELRTLMASVQDPDVLDHLRSISAMLSPRQRGTDLQVSPRELDVLTLVALGYSYPEVGRRLGLTAQTVKTYMRDITARFGVHGRHEAVALGRRLGLLL